MAQQYGLATKKKQNLHKIWWFVPCVFVLALFSGLVATQYMAYKLNYHPRLGSFLLVDSFKVYAPWKFLQWQHLAIPAIFDLAVRLCILAFAIPQIAFFLVVFVLGKPKGINDIHGSARWATLEEIKKMSLLEGKGVYIGGYYEEKKRKIHYLRHNGPEHILCFAPTRSGKGVGLILPTLLAWEGSSISLDLKGENWALTAGYRKSIGHKVLRFDPTDVSGKGVRFNPLEEIRLESLYASQDIQNLAIMLIDPDGKGLSDHWTKAAFSFFSGVIFHCCIVKLASESRFATLQDLVLMLADETKTTEELLDEMLEINHAELLQKCFPEGTGREEAHIFIASSAREMKNKDEKEAAGVLSSAGTALGLYKDPVVCMNTACSDFRLKDLMNHETPVDLYLVIPPNSIDRLKPIIRLMLHMICNHVCAEMSFAGGRSVAGYKHRLLFMLDEFPALGKIVSVENVLPYIAGYGGKMYLITQNLKQLNKEYGKENSIMANCHVSLAYATSDPETTRLLSDMAGKTTVVQNKTSISGNKGGFKKNESFNVQEVARSLLTPDECSRIPGITFESGNAQPGDMLIFVAGNSPIYGKQSLYFIDPTFMTRAKIEAPAETDRICKSASISLSTPNKKEPENKENQVVSSSFSTFLQEEE